MSPAVQCWAHIDTTDPLGTSQLPFGQKGPNRVRACQGTHPPAWLPGAGKPVSPAAAGPVSRGLGVASRGHTSGDFHSLALK